MSRGVHNIYVLCILATLMANGQKEEVAKPTTAVQQQQNATSLPTAIPVLAPAAAGINPSGVNMTALTAIQAAMDERGKVLAEKAIVVAKGLDDIESQSPETLFQGVKLESEMVDPKVVGMELEEYKKAQADSTPDAAKQSKHAQEAFVGELTPPIIILEPSGEDPLQKYLFLKILKCKQAGKSLNEKNKEIAMAQKKLEESKVKKMENENEEEEEENNEEGEKEGEEQEEKNEEGEQEEDLSRRKERKKEKKEKKEEKKKKKEEE